MTKPRLINENPKIVRDTLLNASAVADDIHEMEKRLTEILYKIDAKKLYVRFGYNSLTGFCVHGLKFSTTQAQRIVTLVRRYPVTRYTNVELRDTETSILI